MHSWTCGALTDISSRRDNSLPGKIENLPGVRIASLERQVCDKIALDLYECSMFF